MQTVDDNPGICKHTIKSLGNKKRTDPANYTNCTLVIDAMSIKKHQQWVPSEQKVVGVVDLGGGIVDEETIASEALVLMAVGIRKRWKSPVSFHFTKGLSSETQKTIILDAVEQLFMVGVHVRVIICDGASVNLATLNQLGCSIPEQVAFTHPVTKQTIYCMLDPVHMIKVLRTCFGDNKTLDTPDGIAKWEHITKLHSIQQDGQVHLANKLRKQHIEYTANKMKVKLATQVFSLSVADAITTLEKIGHPDFVGASVTAKFLKVSRD